MNDSAQQDWNHFWSGSAPAPAYARGGRSHPNLDQAWMDFFGQARAQLAAPVQAIDLASGTGVMVDYLRQAFEGAGASISCLDSSPAAIASIRQRFPAVTGHHADARKTGLPAGAYDIVTSQFGIEYAGEAAFEEAMRLVRPGGFISLVIHCQDGQIALDGQRSLAAAQRVLQANLLKNAGKAFSCGFTYFGTGKGLMPYKNASAELQRSMDVSAAVVREFGPEIANRSIARLLDDLQAMSAELRSLDKAETLKWLGAMTAELSAFAGRMDALCKAAAGEEVIGRLKTSLLAGGFVIARADKIEGSEGGAPLAWCIHARKQAGAA